MTYGGLKMVDIVNNIFFVVDFCLAFLVDGTCFLFNSILYTEFALNMLLVFTVFLMIKTIILYFEIEKSKKLREEESSRDFDRWLKDGYSKVEVFEAEVIEKSEARWVSSRRFVGYTQPMSSIVGSMPRYIEEEEKEGFDFFLVKYWTPDGYRIIEDFYDSKARLYCKRYSIGDKVTFEKTTRYFENGEIYERDYTIRKR